MVLYKTYLEQEEKSIGGDGEYVEGNLKKISSWSEISSFTHTLSFASDWRRMLDAPHKHHYAQVWGLFVEENLFGLVSFFYDAVTDTVQVPFLERMKNASTTTQYKYISKHLFGLVCFWADKNRGKDIWVCFESKNSQQLIAFYRKILGSVTNPIFNNPVHRLLADENLQRLKTLIFEEKDA